ncbi:hypothetical protein DFP72DRAFT_851765 [Ephemerocybe angulata]|uniref:Uncharacterized protein n=1 Tax=Ephemerocybe angulata TaxID=980116 RepID=A0A8H6HQ49_9AGAR|nr:hypothetical protein DFP72DRAFT_851765 [Tulosesus angulatus]
MEEVRQERQLAQEHLGNIAATSRVEQDIPGPPYISLALPEDYEVILATARDSFRHGPAFRYFGNGKEVVVAAHLSAIENLLPPTKEKQLRGVFEIFFKSTMLLKGRITVVIDP